MHTPCSDCKRAPWPSRPTRGCPGLHHVEVRGVLDEGDPTSPFTGQDFQVSGCAFVQRASLLAISARGVTEPSIRMGANAPNNGPPAAPRSREEDSRGASRHVDHAQTRTSSWFELRPSSSGRLSVLSNPQENFLKGSVIDVQKNGIREVDIGGWILTPAPSVYFELFGSFRSAINPRHEFFVVARSGDDFRA